ncbi:hypothetical protein BDV3_000591 [Batrachochytrium dendrobatidis]
MQWLLLALWTTLAAADRVSVECIPKDHSLVNTGINRAVVSIAAPQRSNMFINMSVQNTTFKVSINAAASDLFVPVVGINDYTGQTINISPTGPTQTVSIIENDVNTGFGFQGTVSIPGTQLNSSNAPIFGIKSQDTNTLPIYTANQGYFGLGYPQGAKYVANPPTVVDAFISSGNMIKNEIALQMCSPVFSSLAYIDIGNSQPSTKCGSNGIPTIWASSPDRSSISLNVKAVTVNSNPIPFPASFQMGTGAAKWSQIDTIQSVILLPSSMFSIFVNALIGSGGLPPDLLQSSNLSPFLFGETVYRPAYTIFWYNLPTISFDIVSNQIGPDGINNATLRITLGPHQYIIKDAQGNFFMGISIGDDSKVVFGQSFLYSLNVVLDRANGYIGFSPGCACQTNVDGFPIIQPPNAGSIPSGIVSSGNSTTTTSTASQTAQSTQTAVVSSARKAAIPSGLGLSFISTLLVSIILLA